MARKKKLQTTAPTKQPSTPRFAPGSEVRIEAGVVAPEYRDIPLGGWTGTIIDVDPLPPISYLIEWNASTLVQLPSVYRSRCERDGLVVETVWLHDTDLEPANGSKPMVIEQPTKIRTRPLRKDDEEDRIRAVFGLTSDDPVPPVTAESLRKYYLYLEEHLPLPMMAILETKEDQFEPVAVVALREPEAGKLKDGLLCSAFTKINDEERILVPLAFLRTPPGERYEPFEDYACWFWNFSEDADFPTGGIDESPPDFPSLKEFTLGDVLRTASVFALVGLFFGAMLGAALGCFENAVFAVQIGATLLGLCGGGLALLVGSSHDNKYNVRLIMLFMTALGMTAGALLGAVLSVLLVAFAGTFLGGLTGAIVGVLLARLVKRNRLPLFTTPLGILIGPYVQAWLLNSERAWTGTWQGALAGYAIAFVLISGIFLCTRSLVAKRD